MPMSWSWAQSLLLRSRRSSKNLILMYMRFIHLKWVPYTNLGYVMLIPRFDVLKVDMYMVE